MASLLWALPGKIFTIIVGLYYYNRIAGAYRLIFWQVVLAFVTESYGAYLGLRGIYNVWLFNIYNLADLVVTAVVATLIMNKQLYSRVVYGALVLLLVVWCAEIYRDTIQKLADVFFVLSSLLLVSTYLWLLFDRLLFKKKMFKEPEFWLCMSVILYFGCTMPFFALYNHIIARQYASVLQLRMINRVLNFTRYPLIGVSVIIAAMQQKRRIGQYE